MRLQVFSCVKDLQPAMNTRQIISNICLILDKYEQKINIAIKINLMHIKLYCDKNRALNLYKKKKCPQGAL